MISKGLRGSLEIHFGFTNVHSVGSCSKIMQELNKKKYSHLIVDVGLSDGSALEILPTIRSLYPRLKIMVFSGRPATVYQRALKQYGIFNYLSKEDDEKEALSKLRKFFFDTAPMENALKENPSDNPFSVLSAREMQVLHYLVKGISNGEIAVSLGIAFSTVSTLKNRILEKTNTGSLKELTDLATLYAVY